MIKGFNKLKYEERLKRLNLTTLETRCLRADLIEVYKIMHGIDGLKITDFFDLLQGGRTRGHNFKIFKKAFRTNKKKYSFSNRVIERWNLLPEGMVSAININSFKNLLDHHLRQVWGFT